MIFNTTYELANIIESPTQEELYNTPEFFAMAYEDIIKHSKCPQHLKEVLNQFHWIGRPNYVQVRIQDYRKAPAHTLGTGWHVDVNTPLVNGREHWAKNLDEFRSMVASFGNVLETEFAKGPIEIDTNIINPFDHVQFATHVASLNPEVVTAAPGQLAIYTAKDIHRASPNYRLGNIRMIIVTVEGDAPLEEGAGEVRLSLKEKGL